MYMSWKNWGDHPTVVGIGVVCALAGLSYTIYDHHIKQEDISKNATVAPSLTTPSIPSPQTASTVPSIPTTQTTPTAPSIPTTSESVDNLEIYRQLEISGAACLVTVEVDGKEVGSLSAGETLKYTVSTGEHIVRVSGCWKHRLLTIVVKGDQKLKFRTKFAGLFNELKLDRIY